ncbi:universal stress protein [Microlunatus lacustris]
MTDWKNVVVGVDGSEESHHVLAWAAEEARTHGSGLTVLTAWSPPVVLVGPGYAAYPQHAESDFSSAMQSEQDAAIEAVLGAGPDLRVNRVLVEGSAAPRLIAASDGADLVVVGSRGHGAFAGMLLGSVSQHVTAHATCPVVVVR